MSPMTVLTYVRTHIANVCRNTALSRKAGMFYSRQIAISGKCAGGWNCVSRRANCGTDSRRTEADHGAAVEQVSLCTGLLSHKIAAPHSVPATQYSL